MLVKNVFDSNGGIGYSLSLGFNLTISLSPSFSLSPSLSLSLSLSFNVSEDTVSCRRADQPPNAEVMG